MPAALYSIQRLCTPFDNIADPLPRAKEVIASTSFSISTCHGAPSGRLHVIARRPVDQLEAFRMVGVDVPHLDLAGV